jgi:hypothetical protein
MRRAGLRVTCAAILAMAASCSDDMSMMSDPAFPTDYASTYTEVRDCRQSGDHDLNMVRVLADPTALAAYSDRTEPFPEGALVLKEEYEFGDADCAGPIKQWTVMEKLAVGSDPDNLDWFWQRVDGDRTVLEEQTPRCAACHQACVPPDGYDGTCTVP